MKRLSGWWIVASVEADDNPNFRRSDHWPFWQAGIKAVFLPDGANFRNPHYHRATDTVETIDFNFMTNIVKTTVACLATLAGPIEAGVGFSEPFTVER